MTDHANPYLHQIHAILPRVLACYDRDPLSPTLGFGDRLYWAWKTHDFPNATPQGAANGLARLLATGQLPPTTSKTVMLGRIDEMIHATRRITARDGSLSEAFPNEKSFCVTALIAFDILCAAEHLEGIASEEQIAAWKEVAAPLIDFIVKNDETHAIISNHLSTAIAALNRWSGAGQSAAWARARELLTIVLDNQSKEGWYSEYGSADPGYETLGIYYLSDVHLRTPNTELAASLGRSLDWLTHCAHPDGSFGGIYGARNTRFMVPGGIEALAPSFPSAAALAKFARDAIKRQRVVTLATIDDPNLAPNFNAYCQAAAEFDRRTPVASASPAPLPCELTEPFRRNFPDASIVIDNGPTHYTVISIAKGGAFVHCRKDSSPALIDPGRCGSNGKRRFSTQALRKTNTCEIADDSISVTAPFVETISERPSPLKFIILRVLALTVFHHRPWTEWIKRALVRRLITGQKLPGPTNCRKIIFGPNLRVIDQASANHGMELISPPRPFTAIHMASAGYWQAGDDTL